MKAICWPVRKSSLNSETVAKLPGVSMSPKIGPDNLMPVWLQKYLTSEAGQNKSRQERA